MNLKLRVSALRLSVAQFLSVSLRVGLLTAMTATLSSQAGAAIERSFSDQVKGALNLKEDLVDVILTGGRKDGNSGTCAVSFKQNGSSWEVQILSIDGQTTPTAISSFASNEFKQMKQLPAERGFVKLAGKRSEVDPGKLIQIGKISGRIVVLIYDSSSRFTARTCSVPLDQATSNSPSHWTSPDKNLRPTGV